jgi:glycine/D-amino acid oxidase-like deaminating enzyme
VWWWIAGCMSAYFILENTNKKVTLVDANKIAHGASGHNAGQIDVFFEKPVQELVETYGQEMTKHAYQAMFDARGRLEEVIAKMNWTGRYAKYIGYNVYTTRQQILDVLEQLALFDTFWLEINEFFVCEEKRGELAIPHVYSQYCNRIPTATGENYIGSHTLWRLGFEATHYATVNSAELCYGIMQYLLQTYPDRFQGFEHIPIGEIQYENDTCVLKTHAWYIMTAHDVVLATNAYQSYTINTKKENHHVRQVRWYMAWYLCRWCKVPTDSRVWAPRK